MFSKTITHPARSEPCQRHATAPLHHPRNMRVNSADTTGIEPSVQERQSSDHTLQSQYPKSKPIHPVYPFYYTCNSIIFSGTWARALVEHATCLYSHSQLRNRILSDIPIPSPLLMRPCNIILKKLVLCLTLPGYPWHFLTSSQNKRPRINHPGPFTYTRSILLSWTGIPGYEYIIAFKPNRVLV